MTTRLQTGTLKPKKFFDLLVVADMQSTPSCYTEAVKYSHWRQAMSSEFMALQSQGTWHLTPPPSHTPVLGCRWTFKTKLNPDGTVNRYKARLVAQGFCQEKGVNYQQTFSPVAKMPTIRVLLIISLHRGWPIHQFDINNAFLHGDLQKDVYMKQPQGFIDPQQPNHVCKLRKALYGLKQAPRQWFHKHTSFLQAFGFHFSKADPSLLIYDKNDTQLYLLIYVDDILISGNNKHTLQQLLAQLRQTFSLKQLDNANLFLGIQIQTTATGLFLHQAHYARDIIHSAGLDSSKPVITPISLKEIKSLTDSQPYDNPTFYRQIAGSLQYLTVTRPDIAFATNIICQHMHSPTIFDFKRLKRLIRYIKGTQSHGMQISKGALTLTAYADADWASNSEDRKSISGFCAYLGPNLISWSVKKQSTVAKSSTEAEYRALAAVTSDVIWLRRLLNDFKATQLAPTQIMCDNVSAIALANNPVFHARTKHIEIDHHFISDHITRRTISLNHISSVDQPADILTKPLTGERFTNLRSKLTICNSDRHFEGGC
ncbi:Retrovirus-related Pol polyprotein from transposon TNT 1-94 [Dendrobium catenatum]|uniref:Retrovirus-related Pol polyprotein from transposon TNT 1-94 n=1 Tax=Dendrobium catenatum TaxID=906689 RepID=A0A2I0WUX8_9ASPA|nr:Retrovirus-related Pol polyprotein from transposon TNT 1-94 [Dendrobium catenatum]